MTHLPDEFQFSQGSLQDYVDCPRRFQLRYVEQVAWPAVQAEPVSDSERYQQQGEAFHRLVHQHLVGLPAERLTSTVADVELRAWWHSYLQQGPSDLPPARYPEIGLSAPLAGARLVAKFDVVAIAPGERAVIVDWKTSHHRLRRRWLSERLQTRVYPYLLVRAGAHLNGGRPIHPEQVAMVYWFANFPSEPERFGYDAQQYEAGEGYLEGLIAHIRGQEGEFAMTDDERRCKYCVYRSLCGRGVQAGTMREMEEEPEAGDVPNFDFDFEQVAEIEW
ncbi:MAG: PD-(D/E)XK nuclease family protein [Anaerolineae bacterium]|nr:PD-(D/E)XK nuclease family protein [Anaerolineae bacterium]